MNSRVAEEVFSGLGVIINGHFVLTSKTHKLHSATYVNKDLVFAHPEKVSLICHEIAWEFIRFNIEVVATPKSGAIALGQSVAAHLSQLTRKEVLAVYAEKDDEGKFFLGREYGRLTCEKRVLVVDDVLTTGGSIVGTMDAVQASNGRAVGVGLLCNRGGLKARDLGVQKLHAEVNLWLEDYDPDDCPLCRDGVPVNTNLGHGKEFLAGR